MDELERLQVLIDAYEAALAELRSWSDPALDELVARLDSRLAAAEFALDELLHPMGATEAPDVFPRRGSLP